MMRSLFSGVSGLKVHQTKMDVIGNNIANVNTVGFKSSSVTFSDIFYQTTQSASGPNAATGAGGQNARQIGLGSTLGSISVNITGQGGSQRTDNPFDLMINGDAFFILNKGGTNYFTKAGNFTVDEAGTLVNSAGYPVMGWQADAEGGIKKDRVSALHVMAEENMKASPAATTQSTFFGNINSQDDAFTKSDVKDRYIPLQMQFYDALGYEYTAQFHIREKMDANGKLDGQYTLDLASITKDGTVLVEAKEDATKDTGFDYATGFTQLTIAFNTSKTAKYYKADGSEETSTDPAVLAAATKVEPGGIIPGKSTAGELERFSGTLDFAAISANATPSTAFDAAGDADGKLTIDFSQLTNYGATSDVDSARGIDGIGKGKAVGSMSSLGIQTDGKIVASYSNGDTRILGQIAVANFANAAGLEKVGENLYAETLNSGSFNGIGEDITANGDKFSTGVLEMSNVDLSTEFVEMITTQRGFQANSRIITVSDSMLEELINLKR